MADGMTTDPVATGEQAGESFAGGRAWVCRLLNNGPRRWAVPVDGIGEVAAMAEARRRADAWELSHG